MEVVAVTTGAIKRAKLQSNHHRQQTNTQLFTGQDALPVAQPTAAKHRRETKKRAKSITVELKVRRQLQYSVTLTGDCIDNDLLNF